MIIILEDYRKKIEEKRKEREERLFLLKNVELIRLLENLEEIID